MKRRPLFRFLGRPQGGVQFQFAIAQEAQQFFQITTNGVEGAPPATRLRSHQAAIEELREKLSLAGVAISEPSWFASLLNK